MNDQVFKDITTHKKEDKANKQKNEHQIAVSAYLYSTT